MADSDAEARNNESRVFNYDKLSKYKAENDSGIARFGGPKRTPVFRESYLKACNLLFANSQDKNCLDEVAVVILYLLRHVMELSLKELIESCWWVRRELGPDYYPSSSEIEDANTHSLSQLLNKLSKNIDKINETGVRSGSSELSIPQSVIKATNQIHNIDQNGQMFRYEHSLGSQEVPSSILEMYENEAYTKISKKHFRMSGKSPNFPTSSAWDIKGFLECVSSAVNDGFHSNKPNISNPDNIDNFSNEIRTIPLNERLHSLAYNISAHRDEDAFSDELDWQEHQNLVQKLANGELSTSDQIRLHDLLYK